MEKSQSYSEKNKSNKQHSLLGYNTDKAVSFLARSGTGKTTLIEKVINILAKTYKVSSIKHTDHDFEMDKPGKDSYRHRQAGAYSTMLMSSNKMAFFSDIESTYKISELMHTFFDCSDIVIIEGFRDIGVPKIELFRKEINPKLEIKYLHDPLLKLVCGDEIIPNLLVPQIDINDAEAITDFILKKIIYIVY